MFNSLLKELIHFSLNSIFQLSKFDISGCTMQGCNNTIVDDILGSEGPSVAKETILANIFSFCIVENILHMFTLVFGFLKIKWLNFKEYKSIVLCLRVFSLLFDCVRYWVCYTPPHANTMSDGSSHCTLCSPSTGMLWHSSILLPSRSETSWEVLVILSKLCARKFCWKSFNFQKSFYFLSSNWNKTFFLQIRNMYTSSKIRSIRVCPIIIKYWFMVHFWLEKSSLLHLRCYFFINFLISNDDIIIFTTYPLYTSIFHVAWIILTKAMMGGATTPLDICPVQTLLGCGQEKWGLDRTTICICLEINSKCRKSFSIIDSGTYYWMELTYMTIFADNLIQTIPK